MKKIIVLMLALFILTATLISCGEKAVVVDPDIQQIRSICNLATLDCYYHNVAKSEKTSGGLFQKDRKFWIEYTGCAKVGIDMNDVTIKVEDNEVTVTLPNAKLLSVDILEDDLNKDSYIQSEDGLIFKNKITAEDQTKAINNAQEEMKKSVESNKSLLLNAQDRAQTLIGNYIKKMGEISNKEFKINWVYPDTTITEDTGNSAETEAETQME